ncbi:hypothetical protein WMY93_021926 [Mugilogobius chulae]|uniref:Reverse transcriptase domain-containing protein n=1 Tax=Mugilogobius chulae TaxID=88201 RepID=A0AAW0NGD1_9GOBI
MLLMLLSTPSSHTWKGRMLFIDYSSAFNTVILQRLCDKLLLLGLTPSLCSWVLSFQTDRPQSVRIGNVTSATRFVNIGCPQGCVLSPLLYTLFTHDCVASHNNTSIIKFADDTTVIGLITGEEEKGYRAEVASLEIWCKENNLHLNTTKTKEMIIDPRKRSVQHNPIYVGAEEVERSRVGAAALKWIASFEITSPERCQTGFITIPREVGVRWESLERGRTAERGEASANNSHDDRDAQKLTRDVARGKRCQEEARPGRVCVSVCVEC